MKALLNLHFGDGMMAGDFDDPVYQSLKRQINKHFTIKQWLTVTYEHDVACLGMMWRFTFEEGVRVLCVHMDTYIDGLQRMQSFSDERTLTKQELTDYKSLLAKVRWPVARVAPQLAYSVRSRRVVTTKLWFTSELLTSWYRACKS